MAEYVVRKDETGEHKIPTKIFMNSKPLKPLSSEMAWEIMKILAEKASYPAEIAKLLRTNEQKVYYHIKQLKAAGLIEVEKTEEMKGGLAKYFKATSDSFTFLPKTKLKEGKEYSFAAQEKLVDPELRKFLEPFVVEGKLNAKIVVGSPDPHGQLKARARDGHLAVELAAFLGSICSEIKYPLIYLDTMIPNLKNENSNLIVVGGPLTNKLCEDLNEKMKISFKHANGNWSVYSEISGKDYIEDATGLIEKIRHPFFSKRSILVIAGKRNSGTRAAIVALTKKTEEIVKPNLADNGSYAKVVEGLDADSDGIIDDVEIKE